MVPIDITSRFRPSGSAPCEARGSRARRGRRGARRSLPRVRRSATRQARPFATGLIVVLSGRARAPRFLVAPAQDYRRCYGSASPPTTATSTASDRDQPHPTAGDPGRRAAEAPAPPIGGQGRRRWAERAPSRRTVETRERPGDRPPRRAAWHEGDRAGFDIEAPRALRAHAIADSATRTCEYLERTATARAAWRRAPRRVVPRGGWPSCPPRPLRGRGRRVPPACDSGKPTGRPADGGRELIEIAEPERTSCARRIVRAEGR